MDVSEYIDAVTGQMRCKRAKAMVAKELSDHIEDQTNAYLEEGMTFAEASTEAVRQMGDAVEVGMELDRIHRPRMDRRTLVLIGIFSLAAVFLQMVVAYTLKWGGREISVKQVPLQVLLGVVIMVGILRWDYTFLGKHPVALWVIVVIFPLVSDNLVFPVLNYYYSQRISIYILLAWLPPVYGALVFHYRKLGWRGMIYSLLWLGLGLSVHFGYINHSLYVFMMGVVCLLVFSYAVVKGWFGIKRLPAILAVWGALTTGFCGMLAYFHAQGGYQWARLQAFFGENKEMNYITVRMREGYETMSLWGKGGGLDEALESSTAMSFYMLLNKLGIIPCVLIIAGFVLLLVTMAAGVSKQKNILGGLVGAASLIGFMVPTVVHLLSNLTLLPYVDATIPFLYPGWLTNAAFYTLLGLYLSVYRYKDVVA